eukprot:6296480-Pyramimonas_sp.AAC.1
MAAASRTSPRRLAARPSSRTGSTSARRRRSDGAAARLGTGQEGRPAPGARAFAPMGGKSKGGGRGGRGGRPRRQARIAEQ